MEHSTHPHRHKPLVLGITGAAGSGKSTITHLLATLGAQTADADALVRWAYNEPEFRQEVAGRFGPGVLDARGGVDRSALAEIVFQDEQALADLECIVHPAVLDQIAGLIEAYRADQHRAPMLALEIPLLYEVGAERLVDRVLVVTAAPEVIRQRLEARGWDAERIAAVQDAQMPLKEKAARADDVIDASGEVRATADEVAALWERLVTPAPGG